MEKKLGAKIDNLSDVKIPAIDDKLAKVDFKVTKIENQNVQILGDLEILKTGQNENTEKIDEVKASVEDLTARADNNDKNKKIYDLKLGEVERGIDLINRSKEERENLEIKTIKIKIKELEEKLNLNKESSATFNDIEKEKPKDAGSQSHSNFFNLDYRPLVTESYATADNPPTDANIKVFNEARCKIGIYPINRTCIEKFIYDKLSLKTEENDTVFNDPKYADARRDAAIDLLTEELKFAKHDITIKDTKMASNSSSNILWITVGPYDVKKIFQRSAQIKNKNISVINFFPHLVWARKESLRMLLKTERTQNPNLRAQIRLGTSDIELFTKFVGEPYWRLTPLEIYGKLEPIGYSTRQFSPPRGRETMIGSDWNNSRKRQASLSPPNTSQPKDKRLTSDTVKEASGDTMNTKTQSHSVFDPAGILVDEGN
jgi:hypothetical protein